MAIRKSLHVCVSLPLSKARRLEASCAILRCEGWPYTKVWRASRGDGCHGYPSQVLTSYRPSGTSRLKEGLYPCAVNTQIKTRQGDRFAQAALRLCSSFVQRRDLRNYPTFIRLNVELVGSRTSRQREPAPASETPPRPCRRVCYCSAAPNAYPATYPRSFAGAEHRYSTKDF